MHKLALYIIDFIFPPSHLELELRLLSRQSALESLPRAGKPEFPFISAIFDYKSDLVKEMIWQIKYKKNKHAIRCAAYALQSRLQDNTMLIPIPISRKRRRERGYNQCELIVDEMIKINPNLKKDSNLLMRTRHIDKQTFKNRKERIENIKNIFEVASALSAIENQEKIAIIDDVTTTGSTLREAKDALFKAGFTNVETLAVAH
ncbi:MAG TPA: hypothetical protein VJI66_00990 [Candidatus Paceibacterota bacterium]